MSHPTDTLAHDEVAQARFVEHMPWYLNGSLDADGKAWVEHHLADSAWARGMVELEVMLMRSSLQAAPEPQGDIGLARLIAQVQAERPAAVARHGRTDAPRMSGQAGPSSSAKRSRLDGVWHALRQAMGGFASPGFALAAWALVLVQAAWIGGFVPAADGAAKDEELTRGNSHAQVQRRLRVSFVPGTTEDQMRQGLIAAGARIVAGPSQFGDYWLVSEVHALDEVRTRLEALGLLADAALEEQQGR